MENEGFDRPFRFIVTGQYLAIHYNGSGFEINRDYHARGSLFYISNDEKKIIHNRTFIADLYDYPDYEGDCKLILRETTVRPSPPIHPSISHPIIDVDNPISADGIDLYHPDKLFSLYLINGDSLWLGDAREFDNALYFGPNQYSDGIPFQLSKHEGKTRIRSHDGKYMTAMMEDSLASHLDEGCKQHTKFSQCSHCKGWYTLGFSVEPQECLSMVPRGLPSMFVLYDGLFYYKVAERIIRVEKIDDASLFQFVG
ncbi:uncharacterized protein N7469_000562 [Penicillium citrinum]|uniref:Uncharacterized protein n=1 Tax=Penicillium citrinum TaxID=5077 RepID=A0A9W9PD72_PENCI|nr:uncharacterized protein N7469_000562 [Penicillium citrinum]KAJ5242235.1 hypothetical protein N7469_000562 [Penicillium citrinum]